MSNQLVPLHRPPSDDLHPSVYAVIIGLTAWFVLSVWLLFGSKSYESMTDAVITFFFIMAVGIPAAIWLTWRNHPEAHSDRGTAAGADGAQAEQQAPFRTWIGGELRTWTGEQRAWQAAVEILLPIMAVAFGITAFGLVYYLTSSPTA